jgi:hypothetical protein
MVTQLGRCMSCNAGRTSLSPPLSFRSWDESCLNAQSVRSSRTKCYLWRGIEALFQRSKRLASGSLPRGAGSGIVRRARCVRIGEIEIRLIRLSPAHPCKDRLDMRNNLVQARIDTPCRASVQAGTSVISVAGYSGQGPRCVKRLRPADRGRPFSRLASFIGSGASKKSRDAEQS